MPWGHTKKVSKNKIKYYESLARLIYYLWVKLVTIAITTSTDSITPKVIYERKKFN